MPEILTESFCERCGTRYTFESSTPRSGPLSGLKVIGMGLRNFVMSDDTTMDEAMAAARSDAERRATSQQLDAFHKTFNFCMSCRQYTCGNCWNDAEAKCLTCAPHLGREIMPAPFPHLDAAAGIAAPDAAPNAVATNGSHPFEDAPPAWPVVDGIPVTAEPEVEADFEPPEEIDLAARLRALDMADATEQPVALEEHPVEAVADADAVEEIAVTETAVDVGSEAAAPETVATHGPEAPAEPVEAQAAPVEAQAAPVEAQAAPVEAEAEPVEAQAEPVEAPAAATLDADPAPAEPAEPATPPALADPETGDPGTPDDRAAAARRQTAALLARFRPGQSLDDALEAFEREQRIDAPGAETTPSPELEAEPVPAAAPEPIVADAPPTPIAAEPESPVTVEPEPEPIAAEPVRDDVVGQPSWPVPPPATPDVRPPAAAERHADGPVERPAPQWPSTPQWPGTPQWPQANAVPPPAEGTILGRPVVPTGGIESLWAASAGEVLGAAPAAPGLAKPPAAVGVQPCINCGLSLSSTARFCRRCGTPQAPA